MTFWSFLQSFIPDFLFRLLFPDWQNLNTNLILDTLKLIQATFVGISSVVSREKPYD